MNVNELLQRAHAANVTVDLDGDALHLRAATPPPDDLVEALRAYKPSIVQALKAERAREAAVDDAWDRIAYLYNRHGRPTGWCTDRVVNALARVEQLWLMAREDPALDRQFHEAVETYLILALSYIATAGDRPEDVQGHPSKRGR